MTLVSECNAHTVIHKFVLCFQRSFQKRLSLRRSQQLTDDFKIKDRIGDDEEIAVPSFQRKMTALAASRKTDVLDDELF